MAEKFEDEFQKELRLKKVDHEHEERMKRMDQEWGLRRDAVQHTKDYSLFTLRSLLVLNGGAILAMLAFIGNLYSRAAANSPIKLHDFSFPIVLFGLGLLATVVASIFGYFNFLVSQKRLRRSFALLKAGSTAGLETPDYWVNVTRISGTVFCVGSLVLFMVGVIAVVCVLRSY